MTNPGKEPPRAALRLRYCAILSSAALAAGLAACGGGARDPAVPAKSSSHYGSTVEHVLGVSRTVGPFDQDDFTLLRFGHVASAAQARELVAIARRYYRAAAAGDVALACSMLYPPIVSATALRLYGLAQTPHSTACRAVTSKLFALHHRELVADARSLRVPLVRLDALDVYLFLRVPGHASAREFSLRRDGHAWKVDQPIDEPLP